MDIVTGIAVGVAAVSLCVAYRQSKKQPVQQPQLVKAFDALTLSPEDDVELRRIKEKFVDARTCGLKRVLYLNGLIKEACATVKRTHNLP